MDLCGGTDGIAASGARRKATNRKRYRAEGGIPPEHQQPVIRMAEAERKRNLKDSVDSRSILVGGCEASGEKRSFSRIRPTPPTGHVRAAEDRADSLCEHLTPVCQVG